MVKAVRPATPGSIGWPHGPSFLSEGLRPSDSPTRSLAGTPYPAPFAWLTRCRSFADAW